MSTVSRHILRQLFLSFTMTIGILIIITWMINALKTFEIILAYGFSWPLFFRASFLPTPKFIAVFLPLATFIAVLFTYARMERESETAAFKAGGIGIVDLARPAILFATVITVIGYVVMLYLMPLGVRQFIDLREELRNVKISSLLRTGTFIDTNRHFTFYIRAKESDNRFRGIFIHDTRDPKIPKTIIAESGRVLNQKDGVRFILEKGSRQSVNQKKGEFSLLDFDRYVFDLDDGHNDANPRWYRPEERYLKDLIFLGPEEMQDTNLRRLLIAHLHYRIMLPLYSIIFAMIALYATLHHALPRHPHTWRYATATGAIFALELLMLGLSRYSEKNIWALGFVYLLTLTALYGSYRLLYRRHLPS